MCLLNGILFPEPTISDMAYTEGGDLCAGELVTVTWDRGDILACALSLNFSTNHSVHNTFLSIK